MLLLSTLIRFRPFEMAAGGRTWVKYGDEFVVLNRRESGVEGVPLIGALFEN